jgi:thiol:disulfide interchange protein DsbD
VKLVADQDAVTDGRPLKVGVQFKLPPGWHIYFAEPGEVGKPTTVKLEVPAGAKSGEPLWQRPSKFTDFGVTTYGYERQTVIAYEIDLSGAQAASEHVFTAHVEWLACKEECVPGAADLSLKLPAMQGVGAVGGSNQDLFKGLVPQASIDVKTVSAPGAGILDGKLDVDSDAGSSLSILSLLFFAFLGGLVLNLMPCVLPVISMKVLSFVKQAGDDKSKIFKHGLWYTAGTLATFTALALLVVALRSAGVMVGWGFQFQSPTFLTVLAAVVLALSLSMLGLFYVNINPGQGLSKLSFKDGYTGSFFTGILATVLSTPCSAPFLGTAIGFAFGQPAYLVLMTFLSVGLGLAAPYLVLSSRPAWLKRIPKPGPWMETFKQVMGFLMMGSVVWLVSIAAVQVGSKGVGNILFFLLAVAFVCYLFTKGPEADEKGAARRNIYRLVLCAALLGSFFLLVTPVTRAPEPDPTASAQSTTSGAIAWKSFNKAELERELASGKTVFIDFTAEWCLTCKVNERTAINTQEVKETLDRLGIVAVKADWTNQDAEITSLLSKLGRSSVPTYAIFPASDPTRPIVLSELVSQAQVLEALNRAGASLK